MSVHCVAVWEWQCGALWLPHAPGVARTLERAHGKQLTRVVLADAEPALRGHYVNLRTLTQCSDTPEGGTVECRVRRTCYGVQSPAGRGASWEWARLPHAQPHAQLHDELRYEPLPMEVQCLLEAAWSSGAESVPWDGWLLWTRRGRAVRPGAVRALRRAPHPPYPLTRPDPPAGRRPRIPQQHTGSSVQSAQSAPPAAPPAAPRRRRRARRRAGPPARAVSPPRPAQGPNFLRYVIIYLSGSTVDCHLN